MEEYKTINQRNSTLPSFERPTISKIIVNNTLPKVKNQAEMIKSSNIKIIEINKKISKILDECNNNKDEDNLLNPNLLSRTEAKEICFCLMEMIEYRLKPEKSSVNDSEFKNSVGSMSKDKNRDRIHNFKNIFPFDSWNKTAFLINQMKIKSKPYQKCLINSANTNFDIQIVQIEYYLPKTLIMLITEIFQHCHLIEATQNDLLKQIISILRFYLTTLQDIFLVLFKLKFLLPSINGEYYRCSFPLNCSCLNLVEVNVECKINSNNQKYIHATAFADNLFTIDLRIDCANRMINDSLFLDFMTTGTINMFRPFRSFEFNFPDILISDISSNPHIASIGNSYIKELQTSLQVIIDWKMKSKNIEDLEFKSALIDNKTSIKALINGNFYHLSNIQISGFSVKEEDWNTIYLPNIPEIFDDSNGSDSSNLRTDRLWNSTIKFLMDNELSSARLQMMKILKTKIRINSS